MGPQPARSAAAHQRPVLDRSRESVVQRIVPAAAVRDPRERMVRVAPRERRKAAVLDPPGRCGALFSRRNLGAGLRDPRIADIHHRQPLILEDEAIEAWLKPGWAPNGLMDVVLADGERAYERRRVSRDVASPRNDSPELLEPLIAMESMGGTGEVQVALR